MSDTPERRPGKSLIPYHQQRPTGMYDHLLHGMQPYPGGLTRAYSMKLAASLPPSPEENSVFTGWHAADISTNALVLARWLQEFSLKHVQQSRGRREPLLITDFYLNLSALHVSLKRASMLAPDPLRDFFPARFEMAFAPSARDKEGSARDPLSMKADLEHLKRELEKLARFPADSNIPEAHRRGIEEFRRLVKSRLIAQVDRAIHIETVAIEAYEDRLPQGETPEATSYRKGVEDRVATWLSVVSNRPSSQPGRGKS